MDSSGIARIVEVLDEKNVVLNVGAEYGVLPDFRFVIYGEGRKITDLDGKDLGFLENFKGYGEVVYVQSTMCILRALSDRSGFKADFDSPLSPKNTLSFLMSGADILVRRGDFARPV